MTADSVDTLFVEGVLERVVPDVLQAHQELAVAKRHVESAEAVADTDLPGAFELAYEAARKAIAAHMRANGIRVRGRPGAHVQTGRYAVAALGESGASGDVAAFNAMRRLRNQVQYDALPVERYDIEEALVHARAIIAAVEADLP